jgi:hypothetical protein
MLDLWKVLGIWKLIVSEGTWIVRRLPSISGMFWDALPVAVDNVIVKRNCWKSLSARVDFLRECKLQE